MNTAYIYLLIFGCAGYLIATDPSIAKAVVFITEITKNKFQIFKWWFIHNPKTPWARYAIHRRSMKMAEELMREFEDKNR
jgi:hypothetical protein